MYRYTGTFVFLFINLHIIMILNILDIHRDDYTINFMFSWNLNYGIII